MRKATTVGLTLATCLALSTAGLNCSPTEPSVDDLLVALERGESSHVGQSPLELAAALELRLDRLKRVRERLAEDLQGSDSAAITRELEELDALHGALRDDLLTLRLESETGEGWPRRREQLIERTREVEDRVLSLVERSRG